MVARVTSTLPEPSEIERSARRAGAAIAGHDLRAAFRTAAELGLIRAGIARERGGIEASGIEIAETWEGLGHGCADHGKLFALAAHALAVAHPIHAHGSERVTREILPRLIAGTAIGAHAASEAGAGSDAMAIAARAERAGRGFRLSGTKQFVTNGADADVFVVLARADEGPSAFVVERGATGLSIGAPIEKMGLDGASLVSIYLDGCEVAGDAILGAPGAGSQVFGTAMLWERTLICAPQVGAIRRQLERGIEHARARRQFGRPIGKNQLVAARVVEIFERYVLARLLLRDAATRLVAGTLSPAIACLTKLKLSEWALEAHLEAVRLHGGTGYLAEAGLEAQLRDAVGGVLYSGTSDMQRVILAAYLGLG